MSRLHISVQKLDRVVQLITHLPCLPSSGQRLDLGNAVHEQLQLIWSGLRSRTHSRLHLAHEPHRGSKHVERLRGSELPRELPLGPQASQLEQRLLKRKLSQE